MTETTVTTRNFSVGRIMRWLMLAIQYVFYAALFALFGFGLWGLSGAVLGTVCGLSISYLVMQFHNKLIVDQRLRVWQKLEQDLNKKEIEGDEFVGSVELLNYFSFVSYTVTIFEVIIIHTLVLLYFVYIANNNPEGFNEINSILYPTKNYIYDFYHAADEILAKLKDAGQIHRRAFLSMVVAIYWIVSPYFVVKTLYGLSLFWQEHCGYMVKARKLLNPSAERKTILTILFFGLIFLGTIYSIFYGATGHFLLVHDQLPNVSRYSVHGISKFALATCTFYFSFYMALLFILSKISNKFTERMS